MSDRKLKGLLFPSSLKAKEPSHSTLSIKKVSSPTLSPTIAHSSQKSTTIIKPHNVPAYYVIPGVQDFFYYPVYKSDVEVQASPWLEPFNLKSIKDLPPLSHGSAHTAADSRGEQTGNPTQIDNDCSNSLCSLVKKLNIQFGSQPKNLEELLQRSFASMPSHSALQSPMDAPFVSPFMRSHTSTYYQGAAGNSVNDVSIRGTSMVKSPFVGIRSMKSQVDIATDEGLILQIAELINHKNDSRIRTAITELLAKYDNNNTGNTQAQNGFGFLNKGNQGINFDGGLDGIGQFGHIGNMVNLADIGHLPNFGNGNNMNNIGHLGNNLCSKQGTIALSSGLTMNAVKRSPRTTACVTSSNNFNANPLNTKIEAARKELFVISESLPRKEESVFVKQKTNEFNVFDFVTGPVQFSTVGSHNFSPLISSGPVIKDGYNLLSGQTTLMSHSISQQAASLSTNSSHSENQRGVYSNKKSIVDLASKTVVRPTFRLTEDLPVPNQILDSNFGTDCWNKSISHDLGNDFEGKLKSLAMKQNKVKSRAANKKLRAKGNKVTVEDYVRHVSIQNKEDSNLTIEETWEESDDWDDEDVKPSQSKKEITNRQLSGIKQK